MITIVGEKGCGKCEQSKALLSQKGIEFQYLTLSELTEEDQNRYIQLSVSVGKTSLPIILNDDNWVSDLDTIINNKRG